MSTLTVTPEMVDTIKARVDWLGLARQWNACQSVIADRLRTSQVEQRRPCLYPWERVVLTPRGELSFCPQDWVGGSVIAEDYRTSSIREVWQGEAYGRLRQAHLDNEWSQHAFCGNCPDWRLTRWPFQEGRSYADMVEDTKCSE